MSLGGIGELDSILPILLSTYTKYFVVDFGLSLTPAFPRTMTVMSLFRGEST